MKLGFFSDSFTLRTILIVLGLATLCGSQSAYSQVIPEVSDDAAEKSGLSLRLETRIRYVYIDARDKPRAADVTTARAVVGADWCLTPA